MRLTSLLFASLFTSVSMAQNAVIHGDVIYTVSGKPIRNGVVRVTNGKIDYVGNGSYEASKDYVNLYAKVVTPGLIDARATVGLTGILNQQGHDQDMLDRAGSIQPELRAIDAYNPLEKLVSHLRGYGITSVNTGFSYGQLISGQTCIVKTVGNTVDDALVKPMATISCTLDPTELSKPSPGTRGKQLSLLRSELIKAREAMGKEDKGRSLRQEAMAAILRREVPLMIYANKAQDIASALRLAKEFGFKMILESGAEAYLLTKELKEAGVPVIVHPAMYRANGSSENQTFENAAILQKAGLTVAVESGFEGYVPKVRVVLFEAGVFAANGMGMENALRAITLDAARILGIDNRVGSLEVGKDGDIALYDGDPFEYASHCTSVLIGGKVVSMEAK